MICYLWWPVLVQTTKLLAVRNLIKSKEYDSLLALSGTIGVL